MEKIKLQNRGSECFINAPLQLLDDMSLNKKYNEKNEKDEELKEINRQLLSLFTKRTDKEKQFFKDTCYSGIQDDAGDFLFKILPSLLFNNKLIHEITYEDDCRPSTSETWSYLMLDTSEGDSIKKLIDMKNQIVETKGCYESFNIKVLEDTSDVVISLNRIDRKKIKKEIKPDKILKFMDVKNRIHNFEVKGCIVHVGTTSDSGHYIYMMFENGKPVKVVDDAKITSYEKYGGEKDYLKNGYIYLYKKIDSIFLPSTPSSDSTSLSSFISAVSDLSDDNMLHIYKRGLTKLIDKKGWLNQDSIMLWMSYLQKNHKENHYFLSNVTQELEINSRKEPLLYSNPAELKKETKMKRNMIVRGIWETRIHSMLKGIDITNYNYLFFPCNIDDNHWILYYYDSRNKKICNANSLDSAEEFDYIGQLLSDMLWYESKIVVSEIERKKTSKQNNKYDCGVYVCWFMYCVSNNIPLATEMPTLYRQKIFSYIITLKLREVLEFRSNHPEGNRIIKEFLGKRDGKRSRSRIKKSKKDSRRK